MKTRHNNPEVWEIDAKLYERFINDNKNRPEGEKVTYETWCENHHLWERGKRRIEA